VLEPVNLWTFRPSFTPSFLSLYRRSLPPPLGVDFSSLSCKCRVSKSPQSFPLFPGLRPHRNRHDACAALFFSQRLCHNAKRLGTFPRGDQSPHSSQCFSFLKTFPVKLPSPLTFVLRENQAWPFFLFFREATFFSPPLPDTTLESHVLSHPFPISTTVRSFLDGFPFQSSFRLTPPRYSRARADSSSRKTTLIARPKETSWFCQTRRFLLPQSLGLVSDMLRETLHFFLRKF